MSLWRQHIEIGSQQLGIWKIEETLDDLLMGASQGGYDIESQRSFKSEMKQKQWLSARLLLHSMNPELGRIHYQETGAPYLKEGVYISMTHSHQMVGILLDQKEETGIDIQHIHPKISLIKKKFASDMELEFCEGPHEIQRLTTLWCAKEAIYKKMRLPGLIFKKEIAIDEFEITDCGVLKAEVRKGNIKRELMLNVEIFDEYIMVYCLNV